MQKQMPDVVLGDDFQIRRQVCSDLQEAELICGVAVLCFFFMFPLIIFIQMKPASVQCAELISSSWCVCLCVFKKNTTANSVKLLVLYFSNLLSPSGKIAAATK